MTPMPTTVTEDTPVSRVAVLLSRHAFRHLPVVDSDGVLVGLALDYSVFSRGTLVWGGRQGCDLWLAYNPDEADDPVALEKMLCEYAPMKRMATPEEIASSVLYLASSEAEFITGSALQIDGGSTAGR